MSERELGENSFEKKLFIDSGYRYFGSWESDRLKTSDNVGDLIINEYGTNIRRIGIYHKYRAVNPGDEFNLACIFTPEDILPIASQVGSLNELVERIVGDESNRDSVLNGYKKQEWMDSIFADDAPEIHVYVQFVGEEINPETIWQNNNPPPSTTSYN